MKKYISNEVNKIKDMISFGMPGHKGRDYFDINLKKDVTEILDTDNLLNPKGAIENSQREISKIFGSKYSFIIPNGSSGALNIAISAVTKENDKILIQRNAHKSIYNSVIINNLEPIYIETNINEKYFLNTGIDVEDIKKILDENSDIKVAVLVSPNYYGAVLKLKEIVKLLHSRGIFVICDEAHGTHFYFMEDKSFCAIDAGCDIVINSTHKSIPSLTQTALLHINCNIKDKILKHLNLFTTTSPSYLFMQSIEEGIDYMEKAGRDEIKNRIKDMNILKKYSINDKIIDDSILGFDPLKFLFRVRGLSGFGVLEKLFNEYNIRLEMADLYFALAIISPLNTNSEIEELKRAIKEIDDGEFLKIEDFKFTIPKKILNPKDAFNKKSKWVDLNGAKGSISAGLVCAYPPGTPIVSFGEEINDDIIYLIKRLIDIGIEVIGIENNKIEVVDELIYNF